MLGGMEERCPAASGWSRALRRFEWWASRRRRPRLSGISNISRAGAPLGSPDASLGSLDALRQLLISRGAPAEADDDSLLRIARAPDHKLAVTLLSARAAAGQSLRPHEQAELAANQHRIDRYREVWSVVSGTAPDACVVKGSSIAGHYPAGLLRAAGDMDVVCPAAQLWAAARELVNVGWQVSAFSIFPARTSVSRAHPPGAGPAGNPGTPEIIIELSQPSDTEIEEPYAVELRTVEVATSILRPATRLAKPLPPVAGSVLALVAERWERPFRTRDVYDLAVLCDHLDPAERVRLSTALTATGLWPEMRELSSLLRRSGLRAVPDLPDSRKSAWRARAARLAGSAVRWSHPVRVLGYLSMTTTDTDRGALADWLSRVVHERIGAWWLLKLGLPLFAVPLPSAPAGDSLAVPDRPGPPAAASTPDAVRLVRLGTHLVALTPVGQFLMTAGSCQETWLTEAAYGTSAIGGAGNRSSGTGATG